VYVRDDAPAFALLEMRRVLGRSFVPATLTPEAFEELLAKIWQQSSGVSQQLVDDMDADIDLMALTEEIPDNEDLLDNDENSPVIRLINAILGEAVKEGASDIHIETFERTLSIRFRVDGVLRPVLQPARKLAPLLVSRIKVMSKLDIAEKRLPQDGRISLRIGRKAIVPCSVPLFVMASLLSCVFLPASSPLLRSTAVVRVKPSRAIARPLASLLTCCVRLSSSSVALSSPLLVSVFPRRSSAPPLCRVPLLVVSTTFSVRPLSP
jgi:hypothetical protein